jgi:flagellar hook-basal body complex protein FliE
MSGPIAVTSVATNPNGLLANLPPASGDDGTSAPFGSVFNDAIGQLDALESQARTAVEGLITGNGTDVHQAMIATQKAEMAFELALSVRNKALQAYQSVMGMQF